MVSHDNMNVRTITKLIFKKHYNLVQPYVIGMSISGACYFGGAFAPDFISYSILRLISVTSGFIATFGLFALMMEIVSTKYRRHVGLFRDLWSLTGNVLVGVFAYFIRDWRMLQIACR